MYGQQSIFILYIFVVCIAYANSFQTIKQNYAIHIGVVCSIYASLRPWEGKARHTTPLLAHHNQFL